MSRCRGAGRTRALRRSGLGRGDCRGSLPIEWVLFTDPLRRESERMTADRKRGGMQIDGSEDERQKKKKERE